MDFKFNNPFNDLYNFNYEQISKVAEEVTPVSEILAEENDRLVEKLNAKTDEQISVLKQQLEIAIQDSAKSDEIAKRSDRKSLIAIIIALGSLIFAALSLLSSLAQQFGWLERWLER